MTKQELLDANARLQTDLARFQEYCAIKDAKIRDLNARLRERGLLIERLNRTIQSLRGQVNPLKAKVNAQKWGQRQPDIIRAVWPATGERLQLAGIMTVVPVDPSDAFQDAFDAAAMLTDQDTSARAALAQVGFIVED